jgi:hypothetical protein
VNLTVKRAGRGNHKPFGIEVVVAEGLARGDLLLIGDTDYVRVVNVGTTEVPTRHLRWRCLLLILGVIAFLIALSALLWLVIP